tara:strand:- start:771 stop:1019 length:249 start_codon:yes stop_codon:yes gene_type:complete
MKASISDKVSDHLELEELLERFLNLKKVYSQEFKHLRDFGSSESVLIAWKEKARGHLQLIVDAINALDTGCELVLKLSTHIT